MPIIAMTANEKAYEQMSLQWGVIPILGKRLKTIKESFEILSQIAMDRGYVSYGDLVVITAGTTFGIAGTTNMMVVENIGDVLVRGHDGIGQTTCGNVLLLVSPETLKPYMARNRIILITRCDPSYKPFVKEAKGVILQNHISDIESEKTLKTWAEQLEKPAIVRADGARRMLKDKQLITLDPQKALVYKGATT